MTAKEKKIKTSIKNIKDLPKSMAESGRVERRLAQAVEEQTYPKP